MDHMNHWPFVIDGQRTTISINGNFQTSGRRDERYSGTSSISAAFNARIR